MREKDGGSAFGNDGGVTVRDYFAAEALKITLQHHSFSQGDTSIAIDVSRAYRVADMMMAERKR